MFCPNRRIARLVLASVLCCALAAAAHAGERGSAFTAALESITAAELKASVDYLADDALEGREAGARGGRMAGDYVAGKLAETHLRPGGLDGGYFQPFGQGMRNVLAVLPGSDPKLKGQVIVVGAHYDHVGYGTSTNSRGPIGFIHNGADDNASGTSGLLEVAQAFSMLPEAPKRSVLFAFWDAEEKGLLGSKHWLANPTIPRRQVSMMLCMDMIGRLRNNRLIVFGSRTGWGLRRLVSSQNDGLDLRVDFDWNIKPNSDHFAFYQQEVPVLLFHTGLHDEYHRPTDDAALIDSGGMTRVARLVFAVACDLANAPQVPGFRASAAGESADTLRAIEGQPPVLPSRLGLRWSPQEPAGQGVRVTEIAADSAAERAGLRIGDRIVKVGDRPVRSGDELCGMVTAAESPVTIAVQRAGEEKPLELAVRLDGKPMRVGILWRVDEAAPGVVILTYVVPGSPAALAGIQPGDRIYQVGGRDFSNDDEFVKQINAPAGQIPLRVERNGRLRTVILRFQTQPLKRAA